MISAIAPAGSTAAAVRSDASVATPNAHTSSQPSHSARISMPSSANDEKSRSRYHELRFRAHRVVVLPAHFSLCAIVLHTTAREHEEPVAGVESTGGRKIVAPRVEIDVVRIQMVSGAPAEVIGV